MRTIRLFAATLLIALAGGVGLAQPAGAAGPPLAPSIASVTSNVGTFTSTSQNAAGNSASPTVVVATATGTAMLAGDTITLYSDSGSVPVATCAIDPSTTNTSGTVTFNPVGDSGGCATAASFTLPSDAKYTFTATKTRSALTSVRSAGFDYIFDSTVPPAPATVSTAQVPNSTLRVSWSRATDPGGTAASGLKSYDVLRSLPDATNPATTSYSKVGSVNDAACTGSGASACSYDDVPGTTSTYFYEVKSNDAAGNASSASGPSPAVAPGIRAVVVPAPSIVSVGGVTTSPSYQPDATVTQPDLVVAVAEGGGTLAIWRNGVQLASKAVGASDTSVTLHAADYQSGQTMQPRDNSITAIQTVGTDDSLPSSAFHFVLPPTAPVITSVSGQTESPAKAASTQPAVGVSWVGFQDGDVVNLYLDEDCDGGPTLVKSKTYHTPTDNTTAGTISFSGSFDWGTTQLANGGYYCFTATVTDPSIADAPTATSPASDAFEFERAPIVKGFVMGVYGTVVPVNSTETTTANSGMFSFGIARALSELPDGSGGYVLDGWGGMHPWAVGSNALPANISGGPYWYGWDIARDVVFLPGDSTAGYILDGWGGIHAFGGAPEASQDFYWYGWDIARKIVLLSDGSGGYVMDGWGGLHPFATGANDYPPDMADAPYWYGWDIARDVVLSGDTGGYILDGWGGVHTFGDALPAPIPDEDYTPGNDDSKALAMTEADGDGGYVLDGLGDVTEFGDSIPIDQLAYPPPISVERDMTLMTS